MFNKKLKLLTIMFYIFMLSMSLSFFSASAIVKVDDTPYSYQHRYDLNVTLGIVATSAYPNYMKTLLFLNAKAMNAPYWR